MKLPIREILGNEKNSHREKKDWGLALENTNLESRNMNRGRLNQERMPINMEIIPVDTLYK